MVQLSMVKPILQFTDPILNKPSQKVKDLKSPVLKQLIEDLVDTADANRPITAGLAAPQIGVSLAVCVCRRVDLEKEDEPPIDKKSLWEIMINPRIIKESKGRSVYWEGCLSVGIGKDSLFGPVDRPNNIVVEYSTLTGKNKTLEVAEFFSHEVQHEIDHLDGVIFLRYVTDPNNIWKRKDLDKYYEDYNEYPPLAD